MCVFSKYPLHDVFFHQWPVNGYVHKLQHGDWFGGKGVGLCRIRVMDYNINIYSAHVCKYLLYRQFLSLLFVVIYSCMQSTIENVMNTKHIVYCKLLILLNLFNLLLLQQILLCWQVILTLNQEILLTGISKLVMYIMFLP